MVFPLVSLLFQEVDPEYDMYRPLLISFLVSWTNFLLSCMIEPLHESFNPLTNKHLWGSLSQC